MTRRLLTLLLLLECVLVIANAQNSLQLLTVKDLAGSWYTLAEVVSGKEYRLQPRPHLRLKDPTESCSGKSVDVELQLWTPQALEEARKALISEKRCRSLEKCLVLPGMVERFGLRDQNSVWQPLYPWVFVNGALPQKQRFKLHRMPGSKERSSGCELSSLVVDLVVMNGFSRRLSPSKSQRTLTFTSADVQWAIRSLGYMLTRFTMYVVSKRELQLLAQKLVTTKKQTEEEFGAKASFIITPEMVNAVQRALVERTTTYEVFKKLGASSSRKRKLAAARKLFVLKNFRLGKTFIAKIPEFRVGNVEPISMSVTVSDYTKTKKKSAAGIDSSNLTSKPTGPAKATSTGMEGTDFSKLLQLLGRIEKLEKLLKELGNMNPMVPVRPAEKEKPTKAKTSTSKKSSDRTEIEDCTEAMNITTRGNIFYLKPAKRLVRCNSKGELIALSRTKGNVDFNKNWKQYRDGFGDPRTGDYWIGLKYLANYTSNGDRCMRLTMKPWKLSIPQREASYSDFQVGGEKEMYQLSYSRFKGNVANDSLSEMNNRSFSTFDKDNDAFIGNCAQLNGGGNWYKFCYSANIFGRHKYLSDNSLNRFQPNTVTNEGMCWKGIHSSQGSMCFPLVSVTMALSKPWKKSTGRITVIKEIAEPRLSCKSKLKRITIKSTGMYHITAGGGAGGVATDGTPGGRGALIRASIFLERGQKLVSVVGCGGSRLYSTGDGGNATILYDAKTSKPIIVAGGGGGAGNRIPGGHGLAGETAGGAWWTKDIHSKLSESSLLGETMYRQAHSWSRCLKKTGYCTTGTKVALQASTRRVYRRRRYQTVKYYRALAGAGGGGGYIGGESGKEYYAGGGGGSSFCHPSLLMSCKKTEGGNRHQVGFLIIKKGSCF